VYTRGSKETSYNILKLKSFLVRINVFAMEKRKEYALFIMPRPSTAWRGAEALWITAAGWAAAAKRMFGDAEVMTPDRIAAPEEVLDYPLGNISSEVSTGKKIYRLLPQVVKTAMKDYVLWKKSTLTYPYNSEKLRNENVKFVWEQHDLFAGPGKRIAKELGVPLITYVHAPVVWETGRWGVKRPVWGNWLERYHEVSSLKQSDLIACVTEEVAQKLESMGIERRRIMVSPMAVDPVVFSNRGSVEQLKKELGILPDKLVIGWTGSFRIFHGLDILVRSFAKVHSANAKAVLVLVGDGAERPGLEALVAQLNIRDAVIFTGRKPFKSIPKYISVFDIAIVSARNAEEFHYSPLKLREYMAAGKATLAPAAGSIPAVFTDKKHLLLYKAGDEADLANKMLEMLNNDGLRAGLESEGYQYVLNQGTWDKEIENALKQLSTLI
jgi:glycosyltransferase involved in cell wall biosynthesis